MPKSKLLLTVFCLLGFIVFNSAFTTAEDAKLTIFDNLDTLDCNACHASWTNSITSGTKEDFVKKSHPIAISYYDKYIANYSDDGGDIDIIKLTGFIDSL